MVKYHLLGLSRLKESPTEAPQLDSWSMCTVQLSACFQKTKHPIAFLVDFSVFSDATTQQDVKINVVSIIFYV